MNGSAVVMSLSSRMLCRKMKHESIVTAESGYRNNCYRKSAGSDDWETDRFISFSLTIHLDSRHTIHCNTLNTTITPE